MIQSVQRAAQILGVLGSGSPRLGVTEIADRLGLQIFPLRRRLLVGAISGEKQ